MSFLEPLCGHLSPKIDKVSEKLTLRYPHEGSCVDLVLGVAVGARRQKVPRDRRMALHRRIMQRRIPRLQPCDCIRASRLP